MTPSDLVADLKLKYPSWGERLDAWMPQYQQLLGSIPGETLGERYMVFMTGYKDTARPPNPATFAASLPMKPRSTAPAAVDDQERKRLVEAANAWWAMLSHAPVLFLEYQHRCRHGPPSPEQLEEIAIQVDYDRRLAVEQKKPSQSAVELPRATEVPDQVLDMPAHTLNQGSDTIGAGEVDPATGQLAEIPFD